MISLERKKDCCGCTACASVCPVNCIEMKVDEEGFLYPQADTQKCIGCGKCNKACPFINKKEKLPLPAVYAAVNKDFETRKASSSGGIFSLLVEYVLQQKGVVFGAAFDGEFNVEHIAVENMRDISRLRGSKYVQSNMGGCFSQAKKLLDGGRVVLFTGTPCQIEGLLRYLGKPYPNLITQDVICHGTPSPAVWREYLKHRSEQANSQIEEVSFRKKLEGKKSTSFYIRFKNGAEHIATPHGKDGYMKLFLYNKCLRPSCHACNSKGLRISDFTIADFWGIETVAPKMNDRKGVSLLLVNTPKGEEVLSAIKDKINLQKVGFKRSLWKNPSYFRSTPLSPKRKKFFKDFRVKPFSKTLKLHNKLI